MSHLTITLLGTSAAVPTPRRGLSGVSVQRDSDYLLFDCGEGTQRQMMRFTGLKAPKAIFITHAHGDHWLGLPGLIASLDMRDTLPDKVLLFAPASMTTQLRVVLERACGFPAWLEMIDVNDNSIIPFDDYVVKSFPTIHSRGSVGYTLREPLRPGRFDPNIALLSGIEPGPDFKRLQNGETVNGLRPQDVIGPPRRGRSFAYTGDTSFSQEVAAGARDVDVLIHEATFETADSARATQTRHSTGADAGQTAAQAAVGRLILTHFSPRADPGVIAKEASELSPVPVVAATDGMKINIPLEAQ